MRNLTALSERCQVYARPRTLTRRWADPTLDFPHDGPYVRNSGNRAGKTEPVHDV